MKTVHLKLRRAKHARTMGYIYILIGLVLLIKQVLPVATNAQTTNQVIDHQQPTPITITSNQPKINTVIQPMPNTATESIQAVYAKHNSPITNKIPYLVNECERLGLNPYLVAAVQAEESGWGKSNYCINKHNCFGYGATDSGNIDYWFNNSSYEEATTKILESLARHYKVPTAEIMSARGYNTRQSWINNINSIMNEFTY